MHEYLLKDKMQAKRRRTGGAIVLIIGVGLCLAGIWSLTKPALYQATVRINVEPVPYSPTDVFGNPQPVPYDPYFIQTEFEIIQSELVLGEVIESLDLNSKWGKRHGNGTPLKLTESLALLKRRMNFGAVHDPKIIELNVVDEDAQESMVIANTIALAYRDFRERRFREMVMNGKKALADRLAEEKQKSNPDPKVVESLTRKLNAEISVPKLVEIVDSATVPDKPIGRNRWLGALELLAGMICLGFGRRRPAG